MYQAIFLRGFAKILSKCFFIFVIATKTKQKRLGTGAHEPASKNDASCPLRPSIRTVKPPGKIKAPTLMAL